MPSTTMTCSVCRRPFEAVRSDARYCSATCRVRALHARRAATAARTALADAGVDDVRAARALAGVRAGQRVA